MSVSQSRKRKSGSLYYFFLFFLPRPRIVSLELPAPTGGPPCDHRGSVICNLAEVWPDFQVQEGLPLPEPAGSAPASGSQNVGISDGHSCGAASFTNHRQRVPALPHGCVWECLPSSLKHLIFV